MEPTRKAESGNLKSGNAELPRITALPTVARVCADPGLRKTLRHQRNTLRNAGGAANLASADAIETLLRDAEAIAGGEQIPLTVMISPALFKLLKKRKQWRDAASLPGMVVDDLTAASVADLRARLAAGKDAPQELVEHFLVKAESGNTESGNQHGRGHK